MDAINNYENHFKKKDTKKADDTTKTKKKRAVRSSERLMDRLGVKQTEPGNIFMGKHTGNGGCCVSLAKPSA